MLPESARSNTLRVYSLSPLSVVTRYFHWLPITKGTSGLSQGPSGGGVEVSVNVGEGISVEVDVGMMVASGGAAGVLTTAGAQAVKTRRRNRITVCFIFSSSMRIGEWMLIL
jgi:hypothetical protein